MTITYEVYLECLKVGLAPNPKKISVARDVCFGVDCEACPLDGMPCWDNYLEASKKYYPKVLKENPEYLL
jgi:hypothetical protein